MEPAHQPRIVASTDAMLRNSSRHLRPPTPQRAETRRRARPHVTACRGKAPRAAPRHGDAYATRPVRHPCRRCAPRPCRAQHCAARASRPGRDTLRQFENSNAPPQCRAAHSPRRHAHTMPRRTNSLAAAHAHASHHSMEREGNMHPREGASRPPWRLEANYGQGHRAHQGVRGQR